MSALAVTSSIAFAGPEGGVVTSGSATITSGGSKTSINQSTNRAIIRWDRFNLGASDHVDFVQPGKNSITVNRIRDNNPSQIDGKITANGKIVMINPNGILFGSSAKVNVGGLVATTSDLKDDDEFMAGGAVKFTKPGKADARIINRGDISVGEAGLVGLVAPHVENHGVINAKLGKVQLASGDMHTIDLAGDGLIKLEISDAVVSQSIKNTGSINADGGDVLITAAQARNAVDALIDHTGSIKADTIKHNGAVKTGRVAISTKGLNNQDVRGKGTILVSGSISAKGSEQGTTGGQITLASDRIGLTDGAQLNASGISGGGAIFLGGLMQGQNGMATASQTFIGEDVLLSASATGKGNGGNVIVWSDDKTSFHGKIDVSSSDGDAGFAEVSSKGRLDYTGFTDLHALNGKVGTLLLDPTDIHISSNPDDFITGSSPFTSTIDDGPSVLNAATLTTALASGNVIVQTRATGSQLGTITVDAALTWGSGNALTLDAHRDIVVNQAITGANLNFIAGNDVQLNADLVGTGTVSFQTKTAAGTIGVGAGQTGALNLDATDLTHITNGWNNISIGRADQTGAMNLGVVTWQDNLILQSGSGAININGIQTLGGNNLTATTAGGAILATAAIDQATGNILLTSNNGNVTLGGATKTSGNLTVNSGNGTIILNGTTNVGAADVALTTTGAAITTNGAVTQTTGTFGLTSNNGNITIGAGGINRTSGTLTINSGSGTIALNGASSIGATNATVTSNGSAISTTGALTQTTGSLAFTSNNGAITIGTGGISKTSGTLDISSGSGIITVSGVVNAGSGATTITTDGNMALASGGALTGTTTLTIRQASIGTAMGLGNAQAGAVNLDATEIGRITNGWTSLVFGRTDGTAAINMGALTWNDHLTVQTGSGAINVNGLQTLTTNNVALTTNGGAISTAGLSQSTGTMTLTSNNGNITIGANGLTKTGGTLDINSGTGSITVNNAIGIGATNATFTSLGNTITTNAGITQSTGSLAINSNNGNISIGAGGITKTGGTLDINSGTGSIAISGASNVGAANTTLTTSGNTITTTANITQSTGSFAINSNNGNISIGAGGITKTSGTFDVNSGTGTISLSGASNLAATNATLTSLGNAITTTAAITQSTGNLTLNSNNGAININAGGGISKTSGNLNINSGSGVITVNAIVNAGSGPAIITTDGNIVLGLANALSGTGALTIAQATAGATMGLGNAQAGAVNLDATEIGRIATTWTTRTFGRTDGTGAINLGALTWDDATTIQTGIGAINVNGTQTATTNNLSLNTLGGAITTTGGLSHTTGTLSLSSGGGVITIGAGGITRTSGTLNMASGAGQMNINGLLNLAATNATLTTTGANIVTTAGISQTSGTLAMTTNNGAITIGAGGITRTSGTMNLTSNNGAITINDVVTTGTSNVTITTNVDLALNANLSGGTGTLAIQQATNGVSMAIGDGQTGTVHLSAAEMARILNNWSNFVFGSASVSGDINVGAHTRTGNVTYRNINNVINLNGAQNISGNLTVTSNGNVGITDTVTGTGILTMQTQGNTAVGLGDAYSAAAFHLSDAELNLISNGWGSLVFGNAGSTAALSVGARSWNDHVTFQNSTGTMTVGGNQALNGNNMTLMTNGSLVLNGTLGGGTTLTIRPTNNTIMGIGTGQAGTLSLTNTELDNILDGWTTIIMGQTGSTAAMNIGAYTWKDNLEILSNTGAINVNGPLSVGANNLTFRTHGAMNFNDTVAGTGTVTFLGTGTGSTIGLGTGQTGNLTVSDTDINLLSDGWQNIVFGSTAQTSVMNVGAATWKDNVQFLTSGIVTIVGDQNVGSNNMTIATGSNLAINGYLSGYGRLTIQGIGTGTTMGIGTTQTGMNIMLDNLEIGRMLAGWDEIVFGRNDSTGVMNIGALNWQYDTRFVTGSGIINVNGAQNSGNNDITFETNGNLNLTTSADLSGSGTLTFKSATPGTAIGIGTGQGGGINLTDAEFTEILDGWSSIVFGSRDMTAQLNVNAKTWQDNVTLMTGSGQLRINGNQTMGANNLTLQTDSDLLLNGNLTGSGQLAIQVSNLATGIGMGTGQAGTLNLLNTELARIVDGWSAVRIGSSEQTGAINLGANTWQNSTTFMTRGNIIINGVTGSSETSGTSLVFVTGGILDNNAGASAINPGGGRYIVYSVNAASDDYNGLVRPTIINGQTYFSQPPSSIGTAGNIYVYSLGSAKILYVQADNKVKVYGDNTPNFTYTYLGGLQGSDALNDALLAASLSAAGALTTDSVGTTRAITGTFTTALGYTVQLTNGTLSVSKAPITIQAVSTSREYGDANPTLSIVYNGLKNGEDDSVIDILANATTTATNLSDVNSYVITASGGADNNYAFNYANGTLAVTKAMLTVTADNATREYGDANPALTVSYSGFKNSEGSGVLDTSPTAATTAINTTGIGNHTITASGGIDNNYNFTYVNGTLAITPATLTVTIDNKTREYGDANPAFTSSVTGYKNSDPSSVVSGLTLNSVANNLSNVGHYQITGSGATASNYIFNYVVGDLNVTKATLTATAQNATRQYGDANPTFSVVYTGFKNSDDDNVIDTKATVSSVADNFSNVGTYDIIADNAVDNNYNFTYVDGDLSVTKARITITAQNATREYGDANPAFSVVYSNFKNGENESVLTTLATASSTANNFTNVGTHSITAGGAVDNNYDFDYVDGDLSITKARITITAQDATREYGDANPAFSVVYSNFKNGENESVLTTLAMANSTATNTTNVGIYDITAGGAVDNNYDFDYIDGDLSITKATITITAQNATREYGDANPAFSVVYSNFKNGENESVLTTLATASSTANNFTNVGTYDITAGGAVDNNYDFDYVDGDLSITKARITITAQNATREYGDANPAFSVVYSNFKNGEDESVLTTLATASSTANNFTNVGTHSITAGGAVDNNYDFDYVNGDLSITKARITITAQNATREYGDANPAFSVVYSNFKNGENESVLTTLATANSAANNFSNVGTYDITASGAVDNNYDFDYVDGDLSITKARITITAQDATREYGDANPAFSVVYSNFKNGENESVLTTLATANSAATNTTNVGTYDITAGGAVDNNYDFDYVNGDLIISKATITITAQNATREYGDANPTFSVVYSNFKNGENESVLTTLATANSAANNFSDVGIYDIAASGAVDNNYDFNYVDGNLSVTKATITITAQNATREYGDANPGFSVVYSNFKNGEDESVLTTLATANSSATNTTNVGTYDITAGGAVDNNYDFDYVDGDLNITKARITITAQDATREYGDANPGFSVVYSNFKNGENESVLATLATASTTANNFTSVGTYNITAGGAVDNNYDFDYVNGDLSITKATVTVTAHNATREYGDANPGFSAVYTGFKNGENSGVIDSLALLASAATNTSNVGTYDINAGGAVDNNYDFTYVDGDLSVTKARITITAQDATREYGDANPGFSVVYSNFKNGEDESVLTTLATANSAATNTTNVGTYNITAGGAVDNNYDFDYVNGDLSITKATVTATAQNATREYGLNNTGLTIAYSGFKNGEDESVLNTQATANSAATRYSNVGSYTISASGAVDNNYNVVYADGSLTVTQATLTATVQNATRIEGQSNPIFSIVYTGFRNNENQGVIDTLATASTTADTSTPVGDYAVTAAGAIDTNYAFSYVSGTLSILPIGTVIPVPNPEVPAAYIPTTVQGFADDVTSQNILNSNMFNEHMPIWYQSDTGAMLGYQDIIIMPHQDLYQFDTKNVNFLIAVTDRLKQRFLLGYTDEN